MPADETAPKFTVIYPEIDVRGNVADRLRAWTSDQTLPRDRYRLVVVLTPDSSEEAAIRGMLGPDDKVIREPVETDTAMWNAGAAVAATPWLVFTEGHSPAHPECLQSLERWLCGNPEAQAGNFEIGHPDDYQMAKISDRWFGEQTDKWEHSWPRLHRAGLAIRREVFGELGGYRPFGQFAPPLLSAKFHAAGYKMELVPGAKVIHVDDLDLFGHHFDTIDFVLGECDAREIEDAGFFETYFGHNEATRNRLTLDPEFLRDTLEAAARFCFRKRRIPPGVIPTTFRLFRRAAKHSEFHIALSEAITLFEEATLLHFPLPREWRYRWFVRAHRRVVEANAAKWVNEQSPPAKSGLPRGLFPIADIGPWSLGGVHSLETFNGRPFRWSELVCTLRVGEGTTLKIVRFDTGELRNERNSGISFAAIGRFPLPQSCISSDDNGIVEIRVPETFASRAETFGLTLMMKPLPTTKSESKEERRLGLPIFSVEVV